jgi:putative transposase
VQYACLEYRELLEKHGITCSMSRPGNCYDNAPTESFFSTFKTELVHRRHYRTRAEARSSVFSAGSNGGTTAGGAIRRLRI